MKRFRILGFIVAVSLFLSLYLCGTLVSSDQTVFGPKKYVHVRLKPQVFTNSFSVTDPQGAFNLVVENGHHLLFRVTSARIWINGTQIIGPSELNWKVSSVTKPITLKENNTIKVELSGLPLTFIIVKIVGTTNHAPMANAGQDKDATVGQPVTLDGRISSDPDNDPITYRWAMEEAPSGSTATLTNPTSVMPTVTPDIPGTYTFSLVVNDGKLDSAPDEVSIFVSEPNVAPTANAGPDQSVVTGSIVTLNGTASSDPDGDPFTYQWTLTAPSGSTTFLDDPASPTPQFTADINGAYAARLQVSDGELWSLPDEVLVVAASPNAPPVARAGDDQQVSRSTTIHLDGTASSDPDDDTITYAWSIVSRPTGSTSTLDNPTSPTPQILADQVGDFVFSLIVSDGFLTSAPDQVVVKVINDAPVANAGPDQEGLVGTSSSFDGSGSSDANGDTLTYQWGIISSPPGSTAALTNPTSVTPGFTPDKPGAYVIQLVANDGTVDSAPDTLTLTVRVMVPNGVGMTQSAAEAAITAAGLSVGAITLEYSTTVPAGNVISQNPASGTAVSAGAFVSLVVSRGPQSTIVPNVVGMTQSAAEAAIITAGLTVGTITQENSATVPSGHIISQNPSGGASAIAGSPVALVVSLGPAQITVPNVVGLTQAAATSAITGVGLVVGTVTLQESPSIPVGNVISQNPLGGTSAFIGSSVNLVVSSGASNLPPDPSTVAPPLDRTVATTMSEATSFLYSGANPIQTGVAPETIDARRVAVLRGRVLDRNNNPLGGVVITILNHPEYGQTLSRADGMFDMTVNGGGPLTIRYRKSGYINAQRQVNAPWQDYAWAPDVVLIPLDSQVTAVDLSAPISFQVARGSAVIDSDGSRQATILFGQGTQAELLMMDGSRRPITTINVRATEYTIGPNGPNAMPAELPPTSAYTYAVELTTDEAIAAGARSVLFSKPVYVYVEDFIGFPVGSAVPAGYYNRLEGKWIASANGRVIRVIGISGGLADVDTNGDNIADTGLGITDEERRELASLYSTGQALWRVPITHFTAWDFNWPEAPLSPLPPQPPPKIDKKEDDYCPSAGNSVIECQNQTLGERIPVVGSPFTLNYRSDRQKGNLSSMAVTIALTGSSAQASLTHVALMIKVAGRVFFQYWGADNFPSEYTYIWDGLDAYGRPVQGRQVFTYEVGYRHRQRYCAVPPSNTNAFAQSNPANCNVVNTERISWQYHSGTGYFGSLDFRTLGFGGWTMDVHHLSDTSDETLYMGDGSRRSGSEGINHIITTVAGNGTPGYSGDGGPATQASLAYLSSVAVGPDGSLYFVANFSIRKVGPDGIITTVAGNGTPGYSGDGGPATEAQLSPYGVTVGPDGSLYTTDLNSIRKVSTDGIITTVAGNGTQGFSGDGGPATQASLSSPTGVAVGPDGSIYIADSRNRRIRKVSTDGIITTVAGNGTQGFSGDGGPATQASVWSPDAIAVGPDGGVYIADSISRRIRKVSTDGIITTVAGNGTQGFSGDGGPATQASFSSPTGVTVNPGGSLYIADTDSRRIRKVSTDGIITTVAGNGNRGFSGDDGPATQASFSSPAGVAVGPDGNIYIVDKSNYRIRRIGRPASAPYSNDEMVLPSDDGSELYVFSHSGRHKKTVNALTLATIYQFTYDSSNLLSTITDGSGNVTTIERDAAGKPAAIVGPYGQRTTLNVNANGYLDRIANPANEAFAFTYTDGGLLASVTDPRNNVSTYQYDNLGSLVHAADPAGGSQALSRTTLTNGYEVARTTALGRTTNYLTESLSTGGQRMLNTFPGGAMTEVVVGTDGSQTITYADGTVISTVQGPDPRFGMQAPVTTSTTVTTPGGLTSLTQRTRTATLSDPNDLFSLTLLTEASNLNGKIYTSTYDTAARMITHITPEGRQVVTTTDAQGRITSMQRTGLAQATYSYDSRGRLSLITLGTGADSRTYSLTYNTTPTDDGLLDSITDPESSTVSFVQYDAAGRLLVTGLPDANQVYFGYDSRGNMTSLTPPGRSSHIFTYTPVNLGLEYIPPDVGTETTKTIYEHNADKQLTRVSRPDGKFVDFVYNPVTGQRERISVLEGMSEVGAVTFNYYAANQPQAGKLASITTVDGGTIQFTYDGPFLTGRTWTGTVSGSVENTFDNNFMVSSETINGGDSTSFSYDKDGLLTQAGSLVLYRDDPARPETKNGLLRGTILSNVTTAVDYNQFRELKDYKATFNSPTGPVALFESYYPVRDKLGRIKERNETISGITKTFNYEYDQVGRLWKVSQNGALVRQYEYDANGNRLIRKMDGTLDVEYDNQDRLLRYGNTTYTYTHNGELKTKIDPSGQTAYTYDVFGNLTRVELPNGTVIDYAIDGANRRIGKMVSGSLVEGFLYKDQLKPVAELDASGTIVSRFVYGSKRNVAEYMIKGGQAYQFISDHLGSPRLVVNVSDGTIAQSLDYDEFGNVLLDTNPGFQPFGFAGGLYDSDTGLVRFGVRDYDARTGRWTGKDPILFNGGSWNLYSYVKNDAINALDARGLQENTNIPESEWDPHDAYDKCIKYMSKTETSCGISPGATNGTLYEATCANLTGLEAEHITAIKDSNVIAKESNEERIQLAQWLLDFLGPEEQVVTGQPQTSNPLPPPPPGFLKK